MTGTEARHSRLVPALLVTLGGFLLFTIQTISGRLLLPGLGGGSAVWSVCLLFFQIALFAGYLYAHGAVRLGKNGPHLHLAVLFASALLAAPLGSGSSYWTPTFEGSPRTSIIALLLIHVGGPFFALASTSSIVQAWWSARSRQSPYFLYAYSNLGSLAALIGYVALVEPLTSLRTQRVVWVLLYAIWAVSFGVFAWRTPRSQPEAEPGPKHQDRPGWGTILLWLALSASGSALLVSTTNALCQEVFVTPLLWILPLTLYLATFIQSFSEGMPSQKASTASMAGIFGAAACAVAVLGTNAPLWSHLLSYTGALYFLCLCVHGELARTRPHSSTLTGFYLTMAAGGGLGGLFASLVAPSSFVRFTEFFIAVSAAAFFTLLSWRSRPLAADSPSTRVGVAPVASLALAALLAIVAASPNPSKDELHRSRNFYGILQVTREETPQGARRRIVHGQTVHGLQWEAPDRRRSPITYFGSRSALGLVLGSPDRSPLRIGVIGLGAGTAAAYGKPGDRLRFYELDPDVVTVARERFFYLKDSSAAIDIVLGDARLSLEREVAGRAEPLDVLVLDAFQSDAIPAHLLTREAMTIYRQRLKKDGVMLFHISNRYLDLAPVVRAISEEAGTQVARVASPANTTEGTFQATWMIATRDSGLLKRPDLAAAVTPFERNEPKPRLWTDDYASLLHVLR